MSKPHELILYHVCFGEKDQYRYTTIQWDNVKQLHKMLCEISDNGGVFHGHTIYEEIPNLVNPYSTYKHHSHYWLDWHEEISGRHFSPKPVLELKQWEKILQNTIKIEDFKEFLESEEGKKHFEKEELDDEID